MITRPLIVAIFVFSAIAIAAPRFAAADKPAVRKPRVHTYRLSRAGRGQFLRWRLGIRFFPNPKLFSDKAEQRFVYRYADRVRVAGQVAQQVKFFTKQVPGAMSYTSRYLSAVELHFFVRGKAAAKKLAAWVDRRCARWVKHLERRMPSPMRSRKYGPTFLSKADCEGRIGRTKIHIREREGWGRRPDFHNSQVTIRLELARKHR